MGHYFSLYDLVLSTFSSARVNISPSTLPITRIPSLVSSPSVVSFFSRYLCLMLSITLSGFVGTWNGMPIISIFMPSLLDTQLYSKACVECLLVMSNYGLSSGDCICGITCIRWRWGCSWVFLHCEVISFPCMDSKLPQSAASSREVMDT